MTTPIVFKGRGANVVGSFNSGSFVQDMPSAFNYGPTVDISGSWTDLGDETAFEFADSEAFTMSCWVKYENQKTGTHDELIMGKSNFAGPNTSEYYFARYRTDGGVAQFACHNDLGDAGTINSDEAIFTGGSAGAPADGPWHHLIGTRNTSNVCNFYVDGVQQTATVTVTGNIGVDNEHLGVGTRNNAGVPDTTGDFFMGYIRDARIYSAGLTETECGQLFGGSYTDTTALEGWWKLDGDYLDSSGNGRNGTQNTSDGYWNSSIYNLNQIGSGSVTGATNSDGYTSAQYTISGGTWNLRDSTYIDSNDDVGNYINLGKASDIMGSTASGNLSMSVWCKPQNTSKGYVLSMHRDSPDSSWASISLNSDGTLGDVEAGALAVVYRTTGSTHAWVGASSQLTVDEWAHIVVVLNTGSGAELYVNGNSVATQSDIFTEGPSTATGSLDFGAMNAAGTHAGDVSGRDVRIYNTSLTAVQVDLLYKGQWDGAPVGWWKFNEGTGAAVTDSGVNEEPDGTIYNATWVNPDYFVGYPESIGNGIDTYNQNLSGTKMQAPRGNLFWRQPQWKIWNDCEFIHNSGTVVFDKNNTGGTNSYSIFDNSVSYGAGHNFGGVKLYNVYNSGNHTLSMRGQTKDATRTSGGCAQTIEGVLRNDSASTFTIQGGSSNDWIGMAFGPGASIWNESTKFGLNTYGSTCQLSGTSELEPFIVSGTDFKWNNYIGLSGYISGTIGLANMDYRPDLVCGVDGIGGNYNASIRLDGNCKFGNIRIDDVAAPAANSISSSSWNFNGFRAEATQFFNWSSPTIGTATGSMLVLTGTPQEDTLSAGITTNYYVGYGNENAGGLYANTDISKTQVIISTELGQNTKTQVNSSVRPLNMMHNVSVSGSYYYKAASNDQQGAFENFIVAGGTYGGYGAAPAWTWNLQTKNFHIANGGVYTPTSDSIALSDGNFNLGGGFIGMGALDFNGSSQYVDIPFSSELDPAATDTFVWEVWMKSDESANNLTGRFIDSGDGGPVWIGMNDSDDANFIYEAYFNIYDGVGNKTIQGTTKVNDDKWHHIAGVLEADGVTMNLYVDGKLEGTNTIDAAGPFPSSTDIQIGRYDSGNYFNGTIARASLWKTALTPKQIRTMMFMDWDTMAADTGNFTSANCVAWYQFDFIKENPTTIYDKSAEGNDGTPAGSLQFATRGTYNEGTSMLNFLAGSGNIAWNGSPQFYDLKITSGATAVLMARQGDAGSGYMDIKNNLWVSGTFKPYLGRTKTFRMKHTEADEGNGVYIGDDGNTPNERLNDFSNFYLLTDNSTQAFPASGSDVKNIQVQKIQLSEATTNWMQTADITSTNIRPESSVTRWYSQGHDLTLGQWDANYSNAEAHLDAGTTLTWTGTDSWQGSWSGGGTLTASGEAALLCYNAVPGGDDANVTDYVRVPNDDWDPTIGTGDFSVSTWVRIRDKTIRQGILGRAYYIYGSNDGWGFGVKNSKFYFQANNSSDNHSALGGEVIEDNVWTHLVGVRASGNRYIYVDGVLSASDALGDSNVDNNTHMIWGARAATPDASARNAGDGAYADTRFYNGVALGLADAVTLASINPATNISGAIYADPDNALGATQWWKFGATATGSIDLTNSVDAAASGTAYGDAKSGYVRQLGSGYDPVQGEGTATFTNTYVSGSNDVLVPADLTFITKGTVVMD